MLYREAGQFKTGYGADQAIFPILQDRVFVIGMLIVAYVVVPLIFEIDYWYQAILIPFLVFSVAAVGLNILTGYCGQLSLGSGAFMAVGAYAAYKLSTGIPEMHFLIVFLLSGLIAGAVGIVFGLPSLRIKGFYLAVATLAAQFFVDWLFLNARWFVNYSTSGTITAPPRRLLPFEGLDIVAVGNQATPQTRYYVALTIAVVLAFLAKNLVRGRVGRSWMAIRDMDVAAEIIGIRPLQTKLLAFAISSFYLGVAGAMMVFLWYGTAEIDAFSINRSFQVLFMVIIGGLGSIMGSFMGAAFIILTPVLLTVTLPPIITFLSISAGFEPPTDLSSIAKQLEFMIFGGLIVFFLIVEPAGLARLWTIAKEKLRLWPFPH